jgi:hypothetical protein
MHPSHVTTSCSWRRHQDCRLAHCSCHTNNAPGPAAAALEYSYWINPMSVAQTLVGPAGLFNSCWNMDAACCLWGPLPLLHLPAAGHARRGAAGQLISCPVNQLGLHLQEAAAGWPLQLGHPVQPADGKWHMPQAASSIHSHMVDATPLHMHQTRFVHCSAEHPKQGPAVTFTDGLAQRAFMPHLHRPGPPSARRTWQPGSATPRGHDCRKGTAPAALLLPPARGGLGCTSPRPPPAHRCG